MTTNAHENFDTELQQLFAGSYPHAGFEDRLVNAVRHQRRWSIPAPIYKAAIAAAAVLAVGTTGYFGNRAITGHPRLNSNQALSAAASPAQQDESRWDFGGGSNSAQDWADYTRGVGANPRSIYQNPFAKFGASSNGWQVKNPDATNAIASDLNPGHQKDGQNVLYGDAHAERMNSPFTGTQHDNIYTPNRGGNGGGAGNTDSILLPQAGGDGGKQPAGNNAGLNYFHGITAGRRATFIVDRNPATPKSVPTEDESFREIQGKSVAPGTALAANAAVARPTLVVSQGQSDTPASNPTSQPTDDRKIIRTGSMEFEVDRFDTAQSQIIKIVGELGGFVGATDSEKLPNGKVHGSISVRVPPERLDTLVLSLRALGELKNQQITAMDITKEYTDLESELTADRAMEERLLDLIHNGKGSVKDLLAAENELGNWRAKIEKAEGSIRYYNAQVALSTLTITLSERDIQTPATAVETETADMGIEAEDVEKARTNAMKAIDESKGRIIQAELKRLDAGQLAARLEADIPPESAGAVIDQLKQLGKVARLELNRQETNIDGTNVVTGNTPIRTERKPTRLLISIYNLANVAPRQTTNINLAADDVAAAYAALAAMARSSGGRVVTSNLDRGDPAKATGALVLEVPPEKVEGAMTAIRAQGEVLKLSLTENTDTQNSTQAKQGLTVQLVSLASVPARETIQQSLAVTDVPAAYQTILAATKAAHGRVQTAQLNEQDRQNVTADLQMEVPRDELENLDKTLSGAGSIVTRNSIHASDVEGTVDSKVALRVSVLSADHLPPRETTRLQIEVPDVSKAAEDAQSAATTVGGRVMEASASDDHGSGLARVSLDLPLGKTGEVLQQIRSQGLVHGFDSSRDLQAPAGPLARSQVFAEFVTAQAIVADQTSAWASIRRGLGTSVSGLMWSLQWIVVGLCLILPWAVIGWAGWKIWHRRIGATGK